MWLSPRVLEHLAETSERTLTALRETFERTLTVLREENSTLRRLVEQAHARSDQLAAELARQTMFSMQPPRPPFITQPTPASRQTSRDPVPGLGNVLDPVPFGDPRGTFASIEEASLLFPTTDGASADALAEA